MSNFSPSEPPPTNRKPLGFDEFIAIFVAFSTIGVILFWGIRQSQGNFNFTASLFPQASPSATPTPAPSPRAVATPEATTPLNSSRNEVVTASPPVIIAPVQPQVRTTPVIITPIQPSPPRASVPPVLPPTPAPEPIEITPQKTVEFTDVAKDYWAFGAIAALTGSQIIEGFPDGSFQPDKPVTRAELAALLQKAFQIEKSTVPAQYQDTPADYWGTEAIATVSQAGFVKGYPGGVYRPDQAVSRTEILVALTSGLNLQSPPQPDTFLKTYQDWQQIPKWAFGQVAAAKQAGLVADPPGITSLNPNQAATRAETAAMIYQALVKAGKIEPPSPSPTP